MSRPAKKAKKNEAAQAPLPPQLANTPLARFVDIDSFVQARQFELNYFLGVLKDKDELIGKTKQAFQMLPKHMRRRAMSHNTYRVPARVRKEEESAAKVKRSTRKRRRRPSQILKDYCSRDKQHTWLETHIWHAKRMRMEPLWGYKLAVKPMEKGERACYRFASTDCTLYESSYFVCLRVIASLGDFADRFLEETAIPARTQGGVAAWDCLLFDKPSLELVAPVSVLPADAASFVLMVHPAAYSQVKSLVAHHWSVEDLKDQLICYKLRGPRSLKVVVDSLEIKETTVAGLLQSASEFNAYQFAENTLVGFSFKQHNVRGPMHSVSRPRVAADFEAGFVPSQQSQELLSALLRWPAELSETSLWGVVKEKQVSTLVPAKVTTRSRTCRFPRREKQTKKAKAEGTTGEGEEEPEMEVEQDVSSSEPSDSEAEVEIEHFIPALLIFRQSRLKRGLGSGWDLLAPAGYGTTLWRRLVYAGGKTTGLREYESLTLEQGQLSFPRDYPTTQAYEQFQSQQSSTLRAKYDRTPSAHRINPERIGFPYPFTPVVASLRSEPLRWGQLVAVRIQAFRRRPEPNSILCLPHPSDLEKKPGPAHEEVLHERTVEPRQASSSAMEAACSSLTPDREVVGIITSGSFSHARGKGYGVGFVLRGRWSEGDLLLFRTPTSRCYHLAVVSEINSG